MNNNNDDKDPKSFKNNEPHEYHYYRDTEGRIKRIRKMNYEPRPGYVRFKFLEKYYVWWKRKSFDFKLMILPWFLGLSVAYFIYKFSMLWSQNDLERQIKARLPFDFSYSQLRKADRGYYDKPSGKKQQL